MPGGGGTAMDGLAEVASVGTWVTSIGGGTAMLIPGVTGGPNLLTRPPAPPASAAGPLPYSAEPPRFSHGILPTMGTAFLAGCSLGSDPGPFLTP